MHCSISSRTECPSMDKKEIDAVSMVERSDLFDASWYADSHPDVALSGISPSHHYVHFGYLMGRSPSAAFDGVRYLKNNPDVAKGGLNPLLHFIRYGLDEGRYAYPAPSGLDQVPSTIKDLAASIHVFQPADLPGTVREELAKFATRERVSVVMPTWNRCAVICRALDSAFAQTLAPHEVIVVDDGSTDDTLEMLHVRYPGEIESGRLILLKGSRGGVSKARNRGLERATGDVIAYLDSDNAWHSDHLLFTVGALAWRRDAESAYSAIEVNRSGEDQRSVVGRRFNRARLLRGNFIDLNAFVHRRSAYERLGGFDCSLRRLVDWDLIIRYTGEREPVHIPVITVDYHLDHSALGNITFTENIDHARDTIYVKYAREYVHSRILTEAQIANASRRLAAMRDAEEERSLGVFHVVVSNGEQAKRLPELGDMDVPIVVWVPADTAYQVHSSPLLTLLPGAIAETLPEGVYWCPDVSQPVPSIDQLRALYLAVATANIEMAVLSYSLDDGGRVWASCLRNQIVLSDRLVRDYLDPGADLKLGACQAKVLRVPPSPASSLHEVELETLLGRDIVVDKKHLLVRERDHGACRLLPRPRMPRLRCAKRKPVILVLPMKVAVGGVERNTIEIMRALKDRYAFVYVTMEKVYQQQGSLAGQVMEVAHRFHDLAEASEHSNYVAMLRMLKESYAPDAVWICNGSMWLCQNAGRVREVFDDVPIVDQQVYDVTEGWIRRYTEPGIQSFDRFIAINSKIRTRFLEEFGMDPQRVDLIYSAIDAESFRERRRSLPSPEELRRKYALPEGRPVFAFMGRLVDQKRPLDFLEVAARRASHHREHYVLVGNGILAEKVKEWLATHPDVDVQWIPYVENTVEFWSVVSGMLVTSAYEGLPIAMLEALSMGVPVISTDVGDIARVLEDHRAGMIVERVGDPDLFADRMEQFVTSMDAMRERLVDESERVLERFSADQISKEYVKCWSAAIAQRASGQEARL